MTLTKAHIVQALAEQNGYPNKQSFNTVETLLEIIKRTLESGEDVMISGFGKFCVKEKKQRRGRNPATGKDMMLEPRKVVTFRCSGKLTDRIVFRQKVGPILAGSNTAVRMLPAGVRTTHSGKGFDLY